MSRRINFFSMVAIVLPFLVGSASAQSITAVLPSVTAPRPIDCTVSGTVLSGIGCIFTSTISSIPAIHAVGYVMDGDLENITIIRTAPYSAPYNTIYLGNGSHTVTAYAYDAYESLHSTSPLATSSPVTFSVENNLPENTCPPNGTACTDISVTTGEIAQIGIATGTSWAMNILALQGSGSVAIVGTPVNGTAAGATLTLPSLSTTAGNLIAVFTRWQSSSQTVTVSDTSDSAPTCTAVQIFSTSSAQWCYFKNIVGGSQVVKVVSSGGAQVSLGYVIQVSGASTTSPVDATASVNNNSASTFNPPNNVGPSSTAINLGFPAANELLLAGGSWSGVHTATAGKGGWTLLPQESSNQSGVEWVNPPTSSIYGIESYAITVNGDGSSFTGKQYNIQIDGDFGPSITNTAAASGTIFLDTTGYTNATHNVVITVYGRNCPSCNNGSWNFAGQWEQRQTFANGASPMALQLDARDFPLCTSALANCPISHTITGSLLNTDGTTSSAGTLSLAPDDATKVNIAGAVVTPGSAGTNNVTFITVTDSSGAFSRVVWVYIWPGTGNSIAHFGKDRNILLAYDAARSAYETLIRASSGQFTPFSSPTTFNYSIQMGQAYAPYYNTVEGSITDPSQTSPTPFSQSLYTSAGSANHSAFTDAANLVGLMNTYNLCAYLLYDSVAGASNAATFNNTFGPTTTWSTPPMTYFLNQVISGNGCVIGGQWTDEVTNKFPNNPLLGTNITGGCVLGSSCLPGPITCTTSPNTCTMITQSGLDLSAGGSKFLIAGSGNATLDYNSTTGALYTGAGSGTGTITFTNPGVGNTTFTSGGFPSLRLEYFTPATWDSTAVSSGATPSHQCPPGGTSAGPCPNYLTYQTFLLLRNQNLVATAPHPPVQAPATSGTFGPGISNWCLTAVGGIVPGDYCEGYWNPGGAYMGDKIGLQDLIGSFGDTARKVQRNMNLATPLIMEGAGTISDFNINPIPQAITSCSGSTITFAQSHGVSNVIPGLARFLVTGTTSSLTGTVNTSGTAVTWVSGSTFNTSWAGAVATVTINAVNYQISAVADTTHMTLVTSAGTQTGATFTVGCDGKYYIISAPTSTTLLVAYANTPFGANTAGGTVTWQDGSTSGPLHYMGNIDGCGSNCQISTNNKPSIWQDTESCPNIFRNKRGQLFTMSGVTNNSGLSTGPGYINGKTNAFVYMSDTVDGCSTNNGSGQDYWRMMAQIPASTGGTAQIISTHFSQKGMTWQTNSEAGPRYMFADGTYTLILGAAGERDYSWQISTQLYDRTSSQGWGSNVGINNFPPQADFNGSAAVQGQVNAFVDVIKSEVHFMAHANANLIAQRLAKYNLGAARLASPDLGQFFETGARSGAVAGNLFMVQSLADNNVSQTATLTPYLVSGQQIGRLCSTAFGIKSVVTIAAGTATDTYTYEPGEFCAYIFPNSFAGEFQFPVFSVKLADVASASKILVQWSYSPIAFSNPTAYQQMFYQTVDCGTGAACQLPFDLNIGATGNRFYRLLYLNSSGVVLATSDVQTL